jgi:hypothetical protein
LLKIEKAGEVLADAVSYPFLNDWLSFIWLISVLIL